MDKDPVCGMTLQPGQEEASFVYQDKTYHFCSQECCTMFKENPKQYIRDAAEASS